MKSASGFSTLNGNERSLSNLGMGSIVKSILAVSLLGFVASAPVWAVDRADLEGTTVRGNRELPKVLYIVPWKKPVPGDLAGRPVQSLLDEALAPVDRDVFARQVQYYQLLHTPAAGK